MEAALCPEDSVATVPRDIIRKEVTEETIGRVVASRYRIERLLGEGGFGRVFVATQLNMGRTVALRTLHTDLASSGRA